MKHLLFRDKHFYILLAFFVVCTLFYYFGELVNLFGWESLRWPIFYTVHDLQRLIFLAPILYASYYYRSRGVLLANLISLLVFLPRAFVVSPSLETTVRTIAFVIMAAILSALTVMLVNRRDNLNKSVEALKQSEAKYRLLADNASDVIWIADMNLHTTYISPSIYAMQGHTPKEAMNLTIEQRFTPESLEKVSKVFMEALANEEAGRGQPKNLDSIEAEYIRKDGSTYWTETRASFIRDGAGKAVGILGVTREISARKQAEEALKASEGKYRLLSENMTDTVWLMDLNLKTVYQSPSAEKLRGYTTQEILELPIEKHLTPGSLKLAFEVLSEEMPKVMADPGYDPVLTLDLEYYCKDGTTVWTESKFSVIRDPSGKPESILAEARNITDRRKAEEALRESEERYRSLIENINDVFYALDIQGNISYISPVVERHTHYKVSDLIGKSFVPLIYPEDLPALLDSFNRLVAGQMEPSEFRILDKDGRIIFVRTSSRPLYKDGEIVGITALMTDITERKQMQLQLEELATHDFLTGLPNRALLTDRFKIAEALARRNKARLAVMSLDLDKFKTINDTLGHAAGDQVLKTISARLSGILRASDTIARVGGDEFVLVMLETRRVEDAAAIGQKILDCFAEPLAIDGHPLTLSTSVGIAIYPEDAQDLETLIKKSDAAMYYSKGHGRNRFKFFSDGDVSIGGDHRSGPPIRD